MDAKTQAWLDGLKATGDISEDEYKVISGVAAKGKVDEYIKGSALRQDDYSRNMADLKKAQDAVEAATNEFNKKQADITKYQNELGQWKTGADREVDKALQLHQQAEAKLGNAVAKLKALAVAQGLDEATVLGDIEVAPPVSGGGNGGGSVMDTSKFVTLDKLGELVKQAERQSTANEAFVSATIADLNQEHQTLFGKPLTNARGLVEGALKAGKPLYEYAAETLKFAEARTQATEAATQKRIDDAVAAERTRLASDAALHNGQVSGMGEGFRPDLFKGASSPILSKTGGLPLPEALDKGSQASGASAAAAAFTAGKYKPN